MDAPTATTETLLEHAEWLRRLAGALTRDPAAAADLVQETWEVALTTPPRDDASVRPWLGGVLRNLARMRARSGARRDRRDREVAATAPTEDVSAEALVERVQMQQLVARCVLELAEPLRQTLLLRYYEGLSGADIARRLGVPAGTVRWRLKEALDQVRGSLDAAHQGERQRWALALAPLGAAPAAGAGPSAGVLLLKGGLVMKTSTKIVVGVVVLAALVVGARLTGLWGGGGKKAATAETETPEREAATPTPPAPASDVFVGDRGGDVARDDDPRGPLRLEGQVIDAGEQPVAGARVAINSNPPQLTVSEADGSFVFTGLLARSYRLEAQAGDGFAGPVRLQLTEAPEPVIMRLQPAGVLRVHVLASGTETPVAGAKVELRSLLTWSATTGADGVAELRGVGSVWAPLHASAFGFAPAAMMMSTTGDPAAPQRQVLTLSRGAAVSGRVIDSAGAAVAGARVLALPSTQPFPVIDARRDGVVSGADGTFRFEAIAGGTYRFAASHEQFAPATSAPIGVYGSHPHDGIELRLDAGAMIAGVVRGSDGKPVAAADVRVVAQGSVFWRMTRQTFTDGKGRFRIAGLPRRAVDVVAAHAAGASALMPLDLAAKGEHQVELVLDITGAIAGVVVDGAGEPVAEAQVVIAPASTGAIGADQIWDVRGPQVALTDAAGKFALRGLPDGAYRVHAASPVASGGGAWPERGTDARPGDTALRLVLPADGKVVGRIQLADGKVPSAFTLAIGSSHPVPFASDDGSFELVAPGGTHSLEIAGGTFVRKVVRGVEVGEGETEDLGVITVEAGRSVSGRVLDAGGAPVAGARVAAGRLISGSGAELNIESEGLDVQETETDGDGRFSMAGFGKFPVMVVAQRDGVGRSASIRVPRGPESAVLDLVLELTGGLDGKVSRDGAPVADTVVIANPLGATSSNFFVVTGADGSFAFDMLTGGEYIVYPMIGGGGGRPKDMFVRVVKVEAGARARVEIEAATGPASVDIAVLAHDGAAVNVAMVMLIGAEVDGATMEALRNDAWLARSMLAGDTTPMYLRQQMVVPARVDGVVAGRYSACAVSIAGASPDDMEAQPMACMPIDVPATAGPHRFEVKLPAP